MKDNWINLKTEFTNKSVLPLIVAVLISGYASLFIYKMIKISLSSGSVPWVIILVILFFLFVSVWLIFGEVRNKFISIYFFKDRMQISKYGGFLFKQSYSFQEIDYWTYSVLSANGEDSEYLYIYSKGKKVAKISEFYHRNYVEIRRFVELNFDSKGYERFRYLTELKEIFQ